MKISIYLGKGCSIYHRRYEKKIDRFLTLKTGEANHMLFIGGPKYGKTTVLRAIAEEIWLSYNSKGIQPLIIIFEPKFDTSKAEKIREIYYKESQKYPEEKLYKKYGEETWKYIEKYVKLMESNPTLYGRPGDFAMGIPNILGKYTKWDGDKTILEYFGLEPQAFPVNRFVFRPRRSLESIQVDNGWETNVIEAKIKYDNISFSFLEKFTHIRSKTLYGERLRRIWDIEKIRDPDKVLEKARELEVSNSPSRTYLKIDGTMSILKKDPLFSKEESFLNYLTNKRINIIDFSSNSDLTTEEENLIFELLVDIAMDKAYKSKIPIFIIVDEIQHFACNPVGLSVIDKIYREGRNMDITLIGATPYITGLNRILIAGCTHIGIVGKITNPEDLRKLKSIIPKIDDCDIEIEKTNSIEEHLEIKKKNIFKGYFVYDKQFIERIEYRYSQSL